MKTRDALAIGHALGRIERTLDAWEESKHKRAANGQFTSGGGGGGSAAFKEATKRRNQTKAKENEAAASKAKKTLSDIDKKIAQAKKDGDQKRVSFLEATKNRAKREQTPNNTKAEWPKGRLTVQQQEDIVKNANVDAKKAKKYMEEEGYSKDMQEDVIEFFKGNRNGDARWRSYKYQDTMVRETIMDIIKEQNYK